MRLLAAADSLRGELGTPLPPREQAVDEARVAIRAIVEVQRYDEATRGGSAHALTEEANS